MYESLLVFYTVLLTVDDASEIKNAFSSTATPPRPSTAGNADKSIAQSTILEPTATATAGKMKSYSTNNATVNLPMSMPVVELESKYSPTVSKREQPHNHKDIEDSVASRVLSRANSYKDV